MTAWHFKTGSQSEKRFIQNMIKSKKNLKHLNAMVRSNMEYKSLHTPSLFIKKDSWHALLHKNKWFAAFELDMFQHVWVCNPAYSCTLLQETNWLQNFHFNFRGLTIMIFIELFFLNLQQRIKWKKNKTKKQKEQTSPIKHEKKSTELKKFPIWGSAAVYFPGVPEPFYWTLAKSNSVLCIYILIQ